MNDGYITLRRPIRSHWIYSNNEHFAAWIKMLFEVNFVDAKPVPIGGVFIDCKRGQSINSLDTWVKVLGRGWTKQRVRTYFKLLEKDHMVELENMKKTTRLTICNYDRYQSKQHDSNTTLTRKQHDLNMTLTPIEEGKEGKEGKKVKTPLSLIAYAQGLVDDDERKHLISEWMQYKIEIKKPMKAERGVKSMISKWSNYSNQQIKSLIELSMAENYTGIVWDKLEKQKKPQQEINWENV